MLKQTIKMAIATILLGGSVAVAGNVTDVLSKQEALSHTALKAYKKHKAVALVKQIHEIKVQNHKLQKQVRDHEIRNLLVFLDICLDEMKTTLKKPYSKDNAQIIADLSVSIQEGTHYVKKHWKYN
jgi:hypothetical protein